MKRFAIPVLAIFLAASLQAAGPAPAPTTQVYINQNVVNVVVDVRTTAVTLWGFNTLLSAPTGGACWLQVFNAPAASVVLGTTVPALAFFMGNNVPSLLPGVSFPSGMSIAVTNAVTPGTGTTILYGSDPCPPASGSTVAPIGIVRLYIQ